MRAVEASRRWMALKNRIMHVDKALDAPVVEAAPQMRSPVIAGGRGGAAPRTGAPYETPIESSGEGAG